MNNMQTPEYSVIIPARNAARFIESTLDSLAVQSMQKFDVLVIDDGSTDATSKIVQSFIQTHDDARFKLIKGPAQGVSAARNLGLSHTKSPFVLFLDADDILAENALERYVQAFDTDTQIAALGQIERITEIGHKMASPDNRALVPDKDQLIALLRKNYIVNGGALAIRTSHARSCGGYDESLRFGEDWEFWCRLLTQGSVAVVKGGPILKYRQVNTGANHQAKGSVFARRVPCIEKIAENPELQALFGAKLSKALRARRIDIFWSGVRTRYQYDNKITALLISFAGLIIYPDSIMRPGLALRFLKSIGG